MRPDSLQTQRSLPSLPSLCSLVTLKAAPTLPPAGSWAESRMWLALPRPLRRQTVHGLAQVLTYLPPLPSREKTLSHDRQHPNAKVIACSCRTLQLICMRVVCQWPQAVVSGRTTRS